MYTGKFTLDSICNNVTIQDPFTTFKRRLIIDAPLILLGMILILFFFVVFLKWNE